MQGYPMKIGFSFSRCIRDIIDGKVDKDDVICIIARTNFDPHNEQHWKQIWEGYTYGGLSYAEWANHSEQEDEFYALVLDLYNNGIIHQPRQYENGSPRKMNEHWYELNVRPVDMSPGVKNAYEKYRLLAGIAGK